jgi:hypothetical protein
VIDVHWNQGSYSFAQAMWSNGVNPSQYSTAGINNNFRKGLVTRGKSKGVKYIIKVL